jgi:hypothetical protein
MKNTETDANNFNPVLQEILQEMCRRVNVDYNTVDFTKDRWYMDHSWTLEEEKDFIDWLTKEVLSNKKKYKLIFLATSSKHLIKKSVEWFVLQYGWKYKETN